MCTFVKYSGCAWKISLKVWYIYGINANHSVLAIEFILTR